MSKTIPLQLQLEMLQTGLMRAKLCAYIDMTLARGEVRLTEVHSKVRAAKNRAKNGSAGAESDGGEDDDDAQSGDEGGKGGDLGQKAREKRKEKMVKLVIEAFTGRSAEITIGEYATISMLKTEIVRKLAVPVEMQVWFCACVCVCVCVCVVLCVCACVCVCRLCGDWLCL
jgi:hypothetical protein